jgi:hypothetical protein
MRRTVAVRQKALTHAGLGAVVALAYGGGASWANRGSAHRMAPLVPCMAYILSAPTYTVPSAATMGEDVPRAPVALGYAAVHKIAPVEASKHFKLGAAVTTYTRAPSALSAPAAYTTPPTSVLHASTLEPLAHFLKLVLAVCPPYSAPTASKMASRSGEPVAAEMVNAAVPAGALPYITYTLVPDAPHTTKLAT